MSKLTYTDLQTPSGTSNAIDDALDTLSIQTPVGQVSTAIYDTMYGINHRLQPNSVPINKDHYGLTFFTRPNMNMTTDNLRQARIMNPLLTTESNSMARALRALLDTDAFLRGYSTPLIDDNQAFIPILTNQLESISGWPDITVPIFTTKAGAYQEEVSMADGVVKNFRTYDIRANFRNIIGDPITNLFFYWCHYQALVFEGLLVPYPQYIVQNAMDYNTRIYRLVLDPTRQYVQKIAACGAAFPIDSPMGNAFNYDSDGPINRANDKVSITFHCNGVEYQDPILIYEFNQTVGGANSDMIGSDADRRKRLVLLSTTEASLFNHRGYPYINPETYELQWWVYIEEYQQLISLSATEEDPLADF